MHMSFVLGLVLSGVALKMPTSAHRCRRPGQVASSLRCRRLPVSFPILKAITTEPGQSFTKDKMARVAADGKVLIAINK